MPVSVIGLGTMGEAIARRLQRADRLARVFDRDPARCQEFPGHTADSPAAAAAAGGVVLLCLPDPPTVEAVAEAVVAGAPPDTVLVDHSTSTPATAAAVAARCHARGLHYLEAPMTGGVRAARDGRLQLIVAGEQAVADRVLPELASVVGGFTHVGPVGTASRFKLVHNLITLGTACVAMEAMLLGRRLGLPAATMFEVFEAGTADSYVIRNTLRRTVLEGDYAAGFKLRLAAKDARLARELAAAAGCRLDLLDGVAERLAAAAADPARAETDYPVLLGTLAAAMGFDVETARTLDAVAPADAVAADAAPAAAGS